MLGVGFWLVATTDVSLYWMMLALIPMGFGAGTMSASNQTQAMRDVPPAHGGTADGLQQMTQRITTAIGNALITGVVFSVYADGSRVSNWLWGATAELGVIAIFIIAALLLAILFWRSPRTTQPA